MPTLPGFRILGSQSDINYETFGKFFRILVQSFRLLGNPSLFYNPVAIQLDCTDCDQNWQSKSLPDFCSIAKSGQSWVDRRHLVAIHLDCALIAPNLQSMCDRPIFDEVVRIVAGLQWTRRANR